MCGLESEKGVIARLRQVKEIIECVTATSRPHPQAKKTRTDSEPKGIALNGQSHKDNWQNEKEDVEGDESTGCGNHTGSECLFLSLKLDHGGCEAESRTGRE